MDEQYRNTERADRLSPQGLPTAQHGSFTPGSQAVFAGTSGLGSFSVSGTNTPTPLAGVPAAVNALENQIATLASFVSDLSSRLESCGVLRPSLPKAGTTSGRDVQPPNFHSSLANVIDGQRARVQLLAFTLADVHERLDL